jgi:hypothetical protein
MTEGQKKFKEMGDKLKAERLAKEEQEKAMEDQAKSELAKNKEQSLTDEGMAQYVNMGMHNIDTEDMRPPTLMLVQAIKNKSELCDVLGNECPDGKMFMKGTNEILDEIESYFIYIKKDHYIVKDKDKASENELKFDGSPMYNCICIRASNFTPFFIKFKKSSLTAPQDLITIQKSNKTIPLFLYKTRIRVITKQNKDGKTYFKNTVTVIGIEADQIAREILRDAAVMYNSSEEIQVEDVEETFK